MLATLGLWFVDFDTANVVRRSIDDSQTIRFDLFIFLESIFQMILFEFSISFIYFYVWYVNRTISAGYWGGEISHWLYNYFLF